MRTRTSWVVRATLGALVLAVFGAPAAHAVQGSAPTAAAAAATVKIEIGNQAACSGALIDRLWVISAKSCFGTAVTVGAPTARTTATIGRANLTSTSGRVADVSLAVPHPDRDVVLLRLASAVTGVAPVTVAGTGPTVGGKLTVTGYGRTSTQWVPDAAHAATYTIGAVTTGTIDIQATETGATICKGDAGGPAFRTSSNGALELVALHHTAYQGGCLGATTTQQSATETRLDNIRDWVSQTMAPTQQLALGGDRIGVLTDDRRALVKEGALAADWTQLLAGAKQVVLDGTRIGVLSADGVAWVKDGATGATFVGVYTNVRQIALSGNRVGVVTNDGEARVKEGDLWAPWVVEFGGVQSMALSGNRIGVVTNGGDAYVKEGDLTADWVAEFSGLRSLVLSGNRIGVVTNGGDAYVKEGDLRAQWVVESVGVTSLALAGNRIGVLTNGGEAYVKEGDLWAPWVLEYGGVKSLALSGDRIGVVTNSGEARVKEGDLRNGWLIVWA